MSIDTQRTPTCVWRATPDLLRALQDRFGDPFDTYVNGSQVWMREDGPNEMTLQYRLHPVAGYTRPAGLETANVFSSVVFALANAEEPPARLEQLWDGLEAFPAYDTDIEPAPLRAVVFHALGIAPDAAGLVDHKAIGDAWEQSRGAVSIIESLLGQLDSLGS